MVIVLKILAIIVMAAVVIVLISGLINMMRGGSGTTSNKLMQARVLLQFVALVSSCSPSDHPSRRLTQQVGRVWSGSTRSTRAPATTARPDWATDSAG